MLLKPLTLLLAASLVVCSGSVWAEPSMCRYGSFVQNATVVDVAALYEGAEMVVIGDVSGKGKIPTDLMLTVKQTLKGKVEKEITVHGQQALNTNLNGFVLPAGSEVLLFLRAGSDGVFEGLEDYNSPCNVLFLVRSNEVVMIEHDEKNPGEKVTLDKIKGYLESHPKPLVYKF